MIEDGENVISALPSFILEITAEKPHVTVKFGPEYGDAILDRRSFILGCFSLRRLLTAYC
jgi:hypothetical protein